METFSRAWLQIGVIPSEGPDGAGWSWVLTVIIFVTAILGVTAVATFSFWLCFYGYRSCGREQAGKTAVSASDDSGSEMDIQKRIAESEAGELGPQVVHVALFISLCV